MTLPPPLPKRNPEPEYLSASAIAAYLKTKYGLQISRISVHNWMTKGARGTKLNCKVINGTRVATVPDIIRFYENYRG